MNDLDLVRELRADIPAPAPSRLAAGRSRLLAAASRPRRYRRLALPVGAVTGAAAVVVAAVLGGTATPSRLRPAPAARVSLAAQILTVAARTVAAEPAARPDDRQWVYARFVQVQTGQATQSDEEWVRFDGRQEAYVLDGQLIVHDDPSSSGGPLSSYDTLVSRGPRSLFRDGLDGLGRRGHRQCPWRALNCFQAGNSSHRRMISLEPRRTDQPALHHCSQPRQETASTPDRTPLCFKVKAGCDPLLSRRGHYRLARGRVEDALRAPLRGPMPRS
jgi:hypothetical protein